MLDKTAGSSTAPPPDRRARRTRERLQRALIALVGERRYEAIGVQDIADRADLGRSTFYLHYGGKDDLLLACHAAMTAAFQFGPHHPVTREALLSPTAPDGLIAAFRHLLERRAPLQRLFHSPDSGPLLTRMRTESARAIASGLHVAFSGTASTVPLDALAQALAGAQLGLMHACLEQQNPVAAEDLARTFHRLRRAALLDAFGLQVGQVVDNTPPPGAE